MSENVKINVSIISEPGVEVDPHAQGLVDEFTEKVGSREFQDESRRVAEEICISLLRHAHTKGFYSEEDSAVMYEFALTAVTRMAAALLATQSLGSTDPLQALTQRADNFRHNTGNLATALVRERLQGTTSVS